MTKNNLDVYDELKLMDNPNIHIGYHCAWIADEEIKIPFQFGGQVQKYEHFYEESYVLSTLAEEYSFLKYLEKIGMGVPIGNWVYFKNVISEHIGGWWCDPMGAYGYEMKDANTCPVGKFDLSELKKDPLVRASEGAWNDLNKIGNVINGYLIDVRRSWFDRIKYLGEILPMPIYEENFERLIFKLSKDASFPFRQRILPYQEFYLEGLWLKGEREVVKRADLLQFNPTVGEVVLDIGCQTGGFCQYAKLKGATVIGIDVQSEYIDIARDLARINGFNICYRNLDIEQNFEEVLDWIDKICSSGIDHLLLLSMGKHFKSPEFMWDFIDRIKAKNTYIETNAIKDRENTGYEDSVSVRGGRCVGYSEDRNTRKLFKIGQN